MIKHRGFSLLEISIVIFIMGLTITALLQMFDWSQMRYREISYGWQQRAGFSDIRVWLRNQVNTADVTSFDVASLNRSVKLPPGYFVDKLKVTKHDEHTLFINLELCEDRNRNGMAESGETTSRLFCFRRRSA